MKVYRTLAGIAGAIVISAALVSAQDKSAQPASGSDRSDSAVTYVGCLQPGANGSFLLTNAKVKGSKDKGALIKVVSSSDKLDLTSHVTHQVEIKGTVEAAGSTPKTDLGTLTVTSVKWRADYCG
jgi:hypothetical protein